MFVIRHNIIFSATAHSILLAAALLIGDSGEIRKASLMTVLLSDEQERSSIGRQEAVFDVKQSADAPVMPKALMKTATRLSTEQEIIPKQNPAPSVPVRPQSDTDSVSAPGLTDIDTQRNSSRDRGSGSAAVGSQTLRGSSGEAGVGTSSVSRSMIGQTTDAGTDAFLKQRIHNALQANLIYPYIAKKRSIEGTVLMEFRINSRGIPEGIRIIKGSNYSILDEAARETVIKTSPFPAISTVIEVPIRFSLRDNRASE